MLLNEGDIVVNGRVLAAPLTGVQRYTRELLARFGNAVKVCAPSRPLQGMGGHFWEQTVLPIYARGNLLWSPANAGPLAVRNQVVTIHDVAPLDHPEWFNLRFAAWYRFFIPRLVRRATRIIAVSEFTKQRLLDITRVSPDKVTVVPNGVDSRFRPSAIYQQEAVIAALSLPTRRYVLSIGSLEPRKNIGRLLKAWSAIHTKIPSDVWLVVGGEKGASRIFQSSAVDKLPPRVFFAGRVPDGILPSLYANAIAFVFVSIYEGFGLPPLEAMATGIPTLTGNLASLPEIVGEGALQVDPHDTEAVAEGIQKLVCDATLRNQLRERGMARARSYSWEASANRTMAILKGALHSE